MPDGGRSHGGDWLALGLLAMCVGGDDGVVQEEVDCVGVWVW